MNAIDAPATIATCAQSLRELGEMLYVAEQHPDFSGRLAELERLAVRAQVRLNTLKDLIVAEYLDAQGGPVLGSVRRPEGGRRETSGPMGTGIDFGAGDPNERDR